MVNPFVFADDHQAFDLYQETERAVGAAEGFMIPLPFYQYESRRIEALTKGFGAVTVQEMQSV